MLPTNVLLNTVLATTNKEGGLPSGLAKIVAPVDAESMFQAHFGEALQAQPAPTAGLSEDTTLDAFVAPESLDPLILLASNVALEGRQPAVLDGKFVPPDGLVQTKIASAAVVNDEPVLAESDLLEPVIDQPLKRDQPVLEQGRNLALMLSSKGGESALPTSSFTAEGSASYLLGGGQVGNSVANATQAAAAPKAMSTLDVPFDDARWQNDFSQRVAWYAKGGVQSAEIKLNPAHLGPVEIHIELNDEQVSVTFYAKNSATREAIEASTVRLKEMLNDEGMDLTESFVSEHAFSGQGESQAQQQAGELEIDGTVNNGGETQQAVASSVMTPSRLLVDYYV